MQEKADCLESQASLGYREQNKPAWAKKNRQDEERGKTRIKMNSTYNQAAGSSTRMKKVQLADTVKPWGKNLLGEVDN